MFLNKKGFEIVGQKGSHVRMKKKNFDEVKVTIIPLHKKLDTGTLLAILRQCEIEKEEFQKEF
ncbi:MAG: type II toxin-antitoxin system HicA family toxin [Candidatus Iainarchaeum sp.]|nr:MAG: YcfA-like protein [archaeon ADurb.Bin336]